MKVTRKRTKRIRGSRKALSGRIVKRDEVIADLQSKLSTAEDTSDAYSIRWSKATKDIQRLRRENMALKEQVFKLQEEVLKLHQQNSLFSRSKQIDG